MTNASRAAAFLAATLLAGACDADSSPSPEPSRGTPSALASAAATVTFEVSDRDPDAAERTIGALRTRLDLLGLEPGEARVGGAIVKFGVARLPEREQLIWVAHPGRLEFRPVLREMGPAEGTLTGDCDAPSFRVLLAGLASRRGAVSRTVEACDATGDARYVLGPAEAGNADVKHAEATQAAPAGTPPAWALTLEMSDAVRWAGLTGRHVGRQLAIVLDGQVQSAPTIQSRIADGTAVLSGSFTESRARVVAAMLRSGMLEAHAVLRS